MAAQVQEAADVLALRGQLAHHTNWVTSIAAPTDPNSPTTADLLVTGSRDKTVLKWRLTREEYQYGVPERALRGHNHFVQDVVLSSDGQFALSASWDATIRLWDLNMGVTTRRFVGHTKDVLSVAFSTDNRQIVSGSRDKSIKLWNTLGECKYSIDEAHADWVTCVRFSPNAANPIIVSGGCDKLVKVWNLTTCKLRTALAGHTGYVSTVTVSPDGSLCASGGRDGKAILWDLNEGKQLYSLDAGSTINTLVFSPNKYWLCAGTDDGIIIWHLESKQIIAKRSPANTTDFRPLSRKPGCTALAWSANGNTLYAGYTDGVVRVWGTTANN